MGVGGGGRWCFDRSRRYGDINLETLLLHSVLWKSKLLYLRISYVDKCFLLNLFLIINLCGVCVRAWRCQMEASGLPGAGVTGSCEPPEVVART